MRGWLLDTNVVSEPMQRRPEGVVLDWLYSLQPDVTFVSVLSLAELDRGVEALPPTDARRSSLARYRRRLEGQFAGRILSLEDETVRLWGVMAGRYQRERGGRMPPVDGLLAATAQRRRLYMATRNVRDFEALGVTAFNPWTDDPADFPLQR